MQVSKQDRGLKQSFGPITVDKVGPSLNPKKHQAQVRQVVTTIYPGVRSGNSLQDGLFSDAEFNAESQSFEENRVAFLPIPIGTTVEQVLDKIKSFPNARLIRILSLNPILSEEQKQAMEKGLSKNEDGSIKTIEDYANAQAVRTEEGGPEVLYKGHRQYRVTSFMNGVSGPVEDIDTREEDLFDMNPIQMTEGQFQAKTAAEAKKF